VVKETGKLGLILRFIILKTLELESTALLASTEQVAQRLRTPWLRIAPWQGIKKESLGLHVSEDTLTQSWRYKILIKRHKTTYLHQFQCAVALV